MTDFLGPKSSKKNYCKDCDYSTCKKSQYDRHLLTSKHKKKTNTDPILTDLGPKSSTTEYVCECGKIYKHKQSLFNHKKKCIFIKNENNEDTTITDYDVGNMSYKDMFLTVVKENKEMRNIIMDQQKQMGELIPKIGNNITNNTTNNTTNNNQKLNIQVFLNTQCKDALNMSDFIKSLEVSLEQLKFTTNNGLAAGLSKTIIENMNKLSLYERPMHCTDVKRETLYIKEDDKWTKDDKKEKIKNAIKKTCNKNYDALINWKNDNPDFTNDDLKQDYFSHTLSTIGKSNEKVDTKVIKTICKETYVKDSIDEE
jgi:hypothetical protein